MRAIFYPSMQQPPPQQTAAETITADKWNRIGGIIMQRPYLQVGGSVGVAVDVPPADIQLAHTFSCILVGGKPVLVPGLQQCPFTPTAAETITVDKWWAEPQQPTRRVRPPIAASQQSNVTPYLSAGPASCPTHLDTVRLGLATRLGDNNDSMRRSGVGGFAHYAFSDSPRSDKRIFAFHCDVVTNSASVNVGLANIWAPTQDGGVGSDDTSVGIRTTGSVRYKNSIIGTAESFSVNQWILCAVDAANQLIWFKKLPSGNWNNDPGADPATGAGGFSYAGIGTTVYAAASAVLGNDGVTFDFTPDEEPPSGYTTWCPRGLRWYAPLGQPLIRKLGLGPNHPSYSWSGFTPTATEDVTVDKWWAETQQPTRRKRSYDGAFAFTPTQPTASDQIGWFAKLDEPARRIPARALHDFNFDFPVQPQVQDVSWQRELSLPVRRKKSYEGYFTVAPQIHASGIGWHVALQEPPRRKPTLALELDPTSDFPVQPQVQDVSWQRELSLPVRLKKSYQGDFAFSPTQPTESDQIGWFEPLREPARPKRKPHEGYFAYGTTQPQANDQIGWHCSLDTPTRRRYIVEQPYYAYSPYFVPSAPGAGNEFNWWPNLSEPVRRKKGATEGWFAFSPTQPTASDGIGWHRPLTEPTRLKLKPNEGFLSYATVQPQQNDIVGWHRALGEPTRRLKNYTTYDYPSFVYTPPTTETVTLDKWFAELQRPTRLRLKPEEGSFGTFISQPQANDLRWYVSLQEPTRRKLSYPGASLFTPEPQANDLRWYVSLHEPTRRKASAREGWLAFTPQVHAGGIAWFRQLGEPSRRKAREPRTELAFVYNPPPPEVVTLDKWFRELSLPTRRKFGFRRGPEAFVFNPLPIPDLVGSIPDCRIYTVSGFDNEDLIVAIVDDVPYVFGGSDLPDALVSDTPDDLDTTDEVPC